MSAVQWEEPRPRGHRRPNAATLELVEMLKANPGRHAHVGWRSSSGGGHHLRRHGLKVVTRKQPDGRYKMYAYWPVDA